MTLNKVEEWQNIWCKLGKRNRCEFVKNRPEMKQKKKQKFKMQKMDKIQKQKIKRIQNLSKIKLKLRQISKGMNKVSIVNFNLHKKYLIDDQRDHLPETHFQEGVKRRNRTPEQTLKRLIKKGLVNYVNPFSMAKSRCGQAGKSDTVTNRHSQLPSAKTDFVAPVNKQKSSQSLFTCSRGHRTSINSRQQRVQTEQKQNSQMNTRYMVNKMVKGSNCEEVLPLGSHVFMDFRNISEQSLQRLNIENQRRTLKLSQVHKVKYDSAWKKYPVPVNGKEAKKSEHSRSKIQKVF